MRPATVPPFVPDGFSSHLEYVLDEAEAAFRRGDTGAGVIGLLHALHVKQSRNEPLPDGFFNRIAKAADAWS